MMEGERGGEEGNESELKKGGMRGGKKRKT